MAFFRKLPSGLWQAQVLRRGVRRSASFASKSQAIAWAGQLEAEILAGSRGEVPNLTVSAILTRYAEEVSRHKKGAKWESVRLKALGRDRIARVRLRALDAPHVADWQKRRLEAVSGASVRRERNLLNSAFEIARKEWKWLQKNPFEGVRRPRDGKPRDRLATEEEIEKVKGKCSPAMQRVVVLAVETGMRAGEISSLREPVSGSVAVLADSKNGTSRRVPLSQSAREALAQGVSLSAGSISTLWAQAARLAGIRGVTFHDLRHYAITRLAKKLTPLELAKMVGHRDLRMLQRYYNEPEENIAARLD
jgi:integrase